MKQQVIVHINIVPQLVKACRLAMHKDKIVNFISGNDEVNNTRECSNEKAEETYLKKIKFAVIISLRIEL